MSVPYMGEIRIMSFNFAPKGWAGCNGQLLPINQNQALFSILGTTFGGDGRVNFALPNMRGRAPVHVGSGYTLGQSMGETAHTLTQSEMPTHPHQGFGSSAVGNVAPPPTALLASSASQIWGTPVNFTTLLGGSISNVGGSQPHENMQPYTVLNFCIALIGIFPSRN